MEEGSVYLALGAALDLALWKFFPGRRIAGEVC